MFKYVKFMKVVTALAVLEFRGDSEEVNVNHFDVNVVSIESENEDAINALIDSQSSEIGCEVIDQDEFKTLVGESAQLKRIRDVVATEIAKKYTIADEFSMQKRATDDPKRVAHEEYVQTCVSVGYGLKMKIGY